MILIFPVFCIFRFTYVGAADGYIEVFNNGEFGNIVERIETPLIMGVEQLETVRDDLLLAGASTHDGMRFLIFHLNYFSHLGLCMSIQINHLAEFAIPMEL